MTPVPRRYDDDEPEDEDEPAPSALTSDRIIAGRGMQISSRRVYSLLRSSIREGAISVDEQLVEDLLVRSMATSRNAVREALQMLAADGLVVRRPRIGTAVAGRITALNLVDLADGTDIEIVLLDRREVPSTPSMRDRLRSNAKQLLMTEASVFVDGEPIALTVDYMEREMAVRFPDWTRVPGLALVHGFEHVRGRRFGSVELVVETSLADARTARLLGTPTGSATLVRETVLNDDDEIPRVLSFAHFRGDRIALTMRMTRAELM